MTPEQLIEESAQAIRRTKYYSGGNRSWAGKPVTRIEKRYATAAISQVLLDLADAGVHFGPRQLVALAHAISREGGDL